MSRLITPKQVLVSFGALFANYFHHHRQQIRVGLDMEPMPVGSEPENNPPPSTSVLTPGFENKIDAVIQEIESFVTEKPVVPILKDYEYQGEYTVDPNDSKRLIPNGKGIYSAKNTKFKMVGNFKEGVVNGPALFIYPDGSRVKTEFHNGEIKGLGVKYFDDMKFEGKLDNGIPTGDGEYTLNDYSKVYVKLVNGMEKAKCYEDDGRLRYKGDFKEGQFDGYGEYFFKNGNKYMGEFYMGKMEGRGVMQDKYGDVIYKGMFLNDKPKDKFQYYTEPAVIVGVALVNALIILIRI